MMAILLIHGVTELHTKSVYAGAKARAKARPSSAALSDLAGAWRTVAAASATAAAVFSTVSRVVSILIEKSLCLRSS